MLTITYFMKGCVDGSVRLMNGSTSLEGRVEMCINSLWITVCDTSWSVIDSRVVCKQLGYSLAGIIIS